jgi:hypothetical protein
MFESQRRSPYPNKPYGESKYSQPRPRIVEETLQSGELQIERKTFMFALKENPRGRFLRITELRNPQSATIIIPVSGLGDFQKLLVDMMRAEKEIPPKNDAHL